MPEPALQRIATRPERLAENVPGRFCVNSECIDCDLCRQVAPANFAREAAKGYSFVYQQPANEREEQQCLEALATCPVGAIEDGQAPK
jgi:ferredoxin